MTDICLECKQPLSLDGIQPNIVKGTMATLGSCTNPECDNYQSTFGFSERKMTRSELDKYAAIRERLGLS